MMRFRSKIIVICSCLISILSTIPLNAQLLHDTATLRLVKKDIDYIYNLQFNNAREVYSKIVSLYPEHPIVYLLNGMMTYWQNYPLLHTSPSHVSFEEDMRECIRLSELNKKPEDHAEYLLSDLCARGFLLLFYDNNDLIMEVTPLTISTYKYLRHAFDYTSGCTDLYYFTGLYNYYREEYPKTYPVYKSLVFLFPPGDIDAGLKQLQTAALSAIVLRAEASIVLVGTFLGFENNLPESTYYCMTLHENYKRNGLYLEMYIRNLLLMKKYDEAEKLISESSVTDGSNFIRAQLIILKGILQEKRYNDYKLAQQYYNKGINELSLFGKYGNEYTAYAYFGLSRINVDDEKHTRKTYRKEALKLAEFKKINFDK
jgi:hypothetical protein